MSAVSNGPMNDYPAKGAFAVTPHATNELAYITRGLWAETAGTVAVYFADGTGPFTFTLAAATLYPFAVKRVLATSTAAGIIGLY